MLGRAVEDADLAFLVDADDAGAGARQHRLAETAAAVDHVAGMDQIVALGAQVVGHAVEGLAELTEIAFGFVHRDLHMQIAGRNHIGGVDQTADRRDQPVREIQPDHDRRQQHDQRDHGIHQAERDGDAGAPAIPSAHSR